MPRLALIVAAASLISTAAVAGWMVGPTEGGRGATLGIDLGDGVTYRFECSADAVIATETGVTKLMDPATGGPIDEAATTLPVKPAMMALDAGKGVPQLVPAVATKSVGSGWDLTIRIAKTDRQLVALTRSDMMSLFTTGTTVALPMDAADRAMWKTFLRDCGVKA